MNLIDFTKNGGYRLKQFTFRKMQEAYFMLLKAFVAFCNVPETGNYILSGMQIDGANITAGYCYIDGELCRFEQTAGTLATKIKKNVVIQSLGFKNGNNENVFRFVNAQVDAIDGTALSAFIRVSPVFDANYVHTDNNFTAALLAKLNGIAAGAEVNVQADWNVANPLSDAFIKNKPELFTVHDYGRSVLGDCNGNDDLKTVYFSIPTTTTNYIVLGTLVNNAADWDDGNDVFFTVREKQTNNFKVALREVSSNVQNLTLDYLILVL